MNRRDLLKASLAAAAMALVPLPAATKASQRTETWIEVTQAVIDASMQNETCPIVGAIELAHKEAREVCVDARTIRFTDWEKHVRFFFSTPEIVRQNIIRFDQEGTIAPFRFDLGCHVATVTPPPKPRITIDFYSPESRHTYTVHEDGSGFLDGRKAMQFNRDDAFRRLFSDARQAQLTWKAPIGRLGTLVYRCV